MKSQKSKIFGTQKIHKVNFFVKTNKKCPVCKSKNIKLVNYIGVKCILCLDCGFDERKHYEVFPEEKVSQKEKARFSPYKKGGSLRGKKIK